MEAAVVQMKSTYARGRILRLLKKGDSRIDPPCSLHFDAERRPRNFCGGCDWQHLSYSSQLEFKREIVVDCLRRIGGIHDASVLPAIASPQIWGYRNKSQVPFGFEPGRGVVAGFYEPGTHRIVDLAACPVQPELAVKILVKAKDLVGKSGLVAAAGGGKPWLRHLLIRTNSGGEAMLVLAARSPRAPAGLPGFLDEIKAAFPSIAGIHLNVQPLESSVVLGPHWKRLRGRDFIVERLGPFSFRLSPGSFFQVNASAAEILYEAATRAAFSGGEEGSSFDLAIDLYCGAGALAFGASRHVPRVVGIEENKSAVQDGIQSAALNNIKNVRLLALPVERAFKPLRRDLDGSKGILALADPPRAGLSEAAVRLLGHPAFKRLVYVSCNPATFSRDAKLLSRARPSYRLTQIQPVDLFPQTSHVELVGLLER